MRAIPFVLAWLLALAPAAVAAPPANDNLANAPVVGPPGDQPLRHTFVENIDTSEATVEPRLVSPLGVSTGAEPTACRPDFGSTATARFGRTAWYILRRPPATASAIEVTGHDTVIALYSYDATTGRVGKRTFCTNRPGTYERARTWGYELERGPDAVTLAAVQVAGVASGSEIAGGPLQVAFNFFPDGDLDGAYDSDDRCPAHRGPSATRGCLPRLSTAITVRFTSTGGAVTITRASVARIPSGSTVELRCVRRCGVRLRRTNVSGALRFGRLVGRSLPVGARFEVRVTHPARERGAYVFGAIGQYVRYDVRSGNLRRTVRCLLPGSRSPRRSCR